MPGDPAQRVDLPADAIAQAARLLRGGGVVAIPTETVYGLGANALDPLAVARVFEIKGRPRFDPLIVHLPDAGAAWDLVARVPPGARQLAQRFWPGPLTLVLAKRPVVPDLVTAGLDSVAVRVPAHPIALALLRQAGVPVAAPSANRFGGISPTTARHVRQELGDAVDLILDGGPCQTGVESTVVSFVGARPMLLRPGGLAIESIEEVVGRLERPEAAERRVLSPGMLERHYAPRTPLVLGEAAAASGTPRVGWLGLGTPPRPERFAAVETLSARADLREAAANLFAAMRRLDEAGLDLIVAQPVPEEGLGAAINDRLRRASRR